jgi:hypothetical protein
MIYQQKFPESWGNVSEFKDWYMNNSMPMTFPTGEVFCSDDATATCVFRQGQFQVELYLIHPKPMVQRHEHPGVEVIKMYFVNGNTMHEPVLYNGQSHGAGERLEDASKGFPLFAFQHWKKGIPTTVASAWKGRTSGPLHDALIKRFHPNALVLDGYADITKNSDYLTGEPNGADN